jgi:hypothetical protein
MPYQQPEPVLSCADVPPLQRVADISLGGPGAGASVLRQGMQVPALRSAHRNRRLCLCERQACAMHDVSERRVVEIPERHLSVEQEIYALRSFSEGAACRALIGSAAPDGSAIFHRLRCDAARPPARHAIAATGQADRPLCSRPFLVAELLCCARRRERSHAMQGQRILWLYRSWPMAAI